MNFNKSAILIIVIFLITFAGCGGTDPANNSANNPAKNTVANGGANNANSGITTNTKPETATTNDAPTLAPVLQGYYAALKNKDENALKKVLSQDFVKSVQTDMKNEKETGNMAAYMAKNDQVQDKPVEVRNEKIEGDKASAELKSETYVNWTKFNFVKEGGEWKLTNQYDDFQTVNKSANNPNVNSGK